MYQEAKSCFAQGGFHLRKWASNSTELMHHIEHDIASNAENQINEENKKDAVLENNESFAKVSVGETNEIKSPRQVRTLG